MDASVWSDYLCPWCYVGRDRSAVLERLGVSVTQLPYELHPEIPVGGRAIRVDGRLASVFDRIERECEAADLPFRRPTRLPNTRRALETAEVVRARSSDAFVELDDALFRAHFVQGLPLDDADLLDELVEAVGQSAAETRQGVEAGIGGDAVERSMARAREVGVTATPAWLIDNRFMIPGAQPPDTIERWVTRLQRVAVDEVRHSSEG